MTTSTATGSGTPGASGTPAAVAAASPGPGAPGASDAPPDATDSLPGHGEDPGSGEGLDGGETPDVPQPEFDRLEDWLTEYFLPMFRRTLGGEYRWCRQWWRHGEAISRLNALWHAWEVLRTKPGTGMGIWYREHLDHQLPILLGARGPFYQCSEDTHREPHEPAADPAPDGWWDEPGMPSDAADDAGSDNDDDEHEVSERSDRAVTGHDAAATRHDDGAAGHGEVTGHDDI